MVDKFGLGHDGVVGSQVAFEDDTMVITEYMPAKHVQAILDHTAHMRSVSLPTHEFGAYVGSVPRPIRTEWRKEWKKTRGSHGLRWGPYMLMKMKSPEFKLLRGTDKKL